MKNKLLIVFGSITILAILFVVSQQLYKKQEVERLGFMAQDDFQLFVRDYSPKLGTSEPKVVLVEFFDPECETCRAFYPIVKEFMSDYEGKLQLVLRYTPFHRNSEFVIKVLEAARMQGKYWETLEIILKNQPAWGDHHHPQPELIWQYLPQVGLDVEKIKIDMNNPEILRMISQDKEDGQKLGVRATPTFYINGKPLQNFGPEFLKEAIEAALNE